MTEHDHKALTFERIDNKLVVCSSGAEPRGLGIFPGDGKRKGGWQRHKAILVPVSEALEIDDSDGYIKASINGPQPNVNGQQPNVNGQQPSLIPVGLQLKHGTHMEFAFPLTEAVVHSKELADPGQCCLDENGRITPRHSSTAFPNSESLRLCNDGGPSNADTAQAFMSKFGSLEEYAILKLEEMLRCKKGCSWTARVAELAATWRPKSGWTRWNRCGVQRVRKNELHTNTTPAYGFARMALYYACEQHLSLVLHMHDMLKRLN